MIRRGECGVERMGGPLWSPAVPLCSPRVGNAKPISIRRGEQPGTHKGPSAPNLTPCHYRSPDLLRPPVKPAAPSFRGGGTGRLGGCGGPLSLSLTQFGESATSGEQDARKGPSLPTASPLSLQPPAGKRVEAGVAGGR